MITKEQRIARLREIGSKGGKSVFEKRGKEYMREIGSKGGKNAWKDKGEKHD